MMTTDKKKAKAGYFKKYYAKNKKRLLEQHKEYFKKWYAENKAYFKSYYKSNPESYKQSHSKYVNTEKGRLALVKYESSKARKEGKKKWMLKHRGKKRD